MVMFAGCSAGRYLSSLAVPSCLKRRLNILKWLFTGYILLSVQVSTLFHIKGVNKIISVIGSRYPIAHPDLQDTLLVCCLFYLYFFRNDPWLIEQDGIADNGLHIG